MLFGNNDDNLRDRVIYKTKPNMLLGCKKAIYGVILLVIILFISPMVIKFIGEMQVYLISHIKLSLTRYAAIAFFVIILIDVVYIIWQLIGWYSLEYTLTDSRVIIKSGVLSTKKNYMPYATIQDVNTSQSIVARMLNVGSVSLYSAYDNNQMELKNISRPSEVEEMIFSRMVGQRSFQAPPPRVSPQQPNAFERDFQDDYLGRNDYYDEYEPITPITHESNSYPRRDYEYYPEDFDNIAPQRRHSYEYEPYNDRYEGPSNSHSQDTYYNQVRDEYSYTNDDYYQDNGYESHYNKGSNEVDEIDVNTDSSQQAIRRHFDKFKR